jgi:hypothetical protein
MSEEIILKKFYFRYGRFFNIFTIFSEFLLWLVIVIAASSSPNFHYSTFGLTIIIFIIVTILFLRFPLYPKIFTLTNKSLILHKYFFKTPKKYPLESIKSLQLRKGSFCFILSDNNTFEIEFDHFTDDEIELIKEEFKHKNIPFETYKEIPPDPYMFGMR